VLIDVGARNLKLFAIPWSLEVSEYMLYAMTFLGAPWVLRENGHIAIELAVERLPPRARARARLAADAVGAAVCAILFVYASRLLWHSYGSGVIVQKSVVFPEWIEFTIVPPVMLLLCGIYLRRLLRPQDARPPAEP
jgi:TRAP-type C4-dicarboxylate transport system permease small subunit